MKKFRSILCLLLSITCCLGGVGMMSANAATSTHYITETHIKAGTYTYWYPSSSPSGYTMVNGGSDSIKINLTTKGNKISAGFRKNSTGTLYPWYSGTLTNKTSTGLVTKVMTSATAKYQAYVSNKNATVELIVLDTSYTKIEN